MSKFWDETHELSKEQERFFDELVPAMGATGTLEGELLRAATNLYYDYFNNGWLNNKSAEFNFLRDNMSTLCMSPETLNFLNSETAYNEARNERYCDGNWETGLDAVMADVVRTLQAVEAEGAGWTVSEVDCHDEQYWEESDYEEDEEDSYWEEEGYDDEEYDAEEY